MIASLALSLGLFEASLCWADLACLPAPHLQSKFITRVLGAILLATALDVAPRPAPDLPMRKPRHRDGNSLRIFLLSMSRAPPCFSRRAVTDHGVGVFSIDGYSPVRTPAGRVSDASARLLDKVMFRLIFAGFALLTLSLFTGSLLRHQICHTASEFTRRCFPDRVTIFGGVDLPPSRFGWRGRSRVGGLERLSAFWRWAYFGANSSPSMFSVAHWG